MFGDVHDKCTRNHKRKRLRDLVQDVMEKAKLKQEPEEKPEKLEKEKGAG